MADISPNSTVSHYRVISKLGEGGMGEVYLAEDLNLHRKVAIKILSEAIAADENLRRFEQEAIAASALNHPNILTIYETGESFGVHFIVSEYVGGDNLRDRIGDLTVNETLDISLQIAAALETAHKGGIVHRDIKPENVMIREDGVVKVLDFGLAKMMQHSAEAVDGEGETRARVRTKTGTVMGTASYMSPEQARGKGTDEKTDIWSLGVVIYEMLARRTPFEGDSQFDVIASILRTDPPPIENKSEAIPPDLLHIVRKALRKDTDSRYQTMKDLRSDLSEVRDGIVFSEKLERSTTTNNEKKELKTQTAESEKNRITAVSDHALPGKGRRGQIIFALIAGALLVSLIGGAYWYRSEGTKTQIDSIAVLPFENEGGNADVEYLSDGMTEVLINNLSELPNLNVKARSSVFRYKGRDIELRRIGQELNVQAILTGRIVQRGDNLTLSWDLVDAKSETHLAGGQYNRKLADIVALQSEIARDVARKLGSRLSGAYEQKITKTYTDNPEAYQLYLKGRFHILKNAPQDTLRAIPYFEKAIELDPRYALAYVGIADAYRGLALGSEMRPTENFPKGKAAAHKALEIDGSLAEAHAILGWITFWYDWDWAAAESECKRALELDPDSGDAHMVYAHVLSTSGRHEEALAEAKRASDLDPLNLRNLLIEVSFNIYAGRTDEALSKLNKVFELDPNYWWAHQWAERAYIAKGQFGEAEASARRAIELNQENTRSIAYFGYALARSGRQTEARAELEKLLRRSGERYTSPVGIAMIYIGLGERGEAFKWLSRGIEQREPRLVFLKVDPIFNDLHDDPRFQDLVRRIGLPQ